HRGHDIEHRRALAREHRRTPEDPGEADRGAADRNPTRLPSCGHRGDERDHAKHDDGQKKLVCGAEGLDRPLFDRTWREVDDRRADRRAGVGLRTERDGEKLGDAECDGGRCDACQHSLFGSWSGHNENLPARRTARPYEVVTAPERLTEWAMRYLAWRSTAVFERELDGDRGQEGRHRRWSVGLRTGDRGVAGQAWRERRGAGPAAVQG